MNKKVITDLDVNSKRVIVRVDFNVPMSKTEEGKITDNARIVAALPTIKYLIENNAKVILLSHLGRPKGEAKKEFSLAPVAKELSKLLNKDVKFLQSNLVVDDNVKTEVLKLKDGEVALLENTRFRNEETKNIDDFSKELAELGDLYINDAFGTSHRAHCSNVGLCKFLPSAVGFLVEKEISIMGKALSNPERPFVAILGGAKVSDKITVIENLIEKVDSIIIGGGMAFTFLKSLGYSVGKSLLEEDKVDLAKELIEKANSKSVKILLPIDVVVSKEFSNDSEFKTVSMDSIGDDYMGLDIGEKTVKLFSDEIYNAKTVVWNGPMGVFEMSNFAKGTFEIAKAIAETDAISIIGGGDSASAAEKSGYKDKITHISTGGGASLEFLEGKILPGIDSIDNK
ncbi:phosphoglycerate kinase [Parvimonas micra]|mgnify:FL=1|uniref:Phosphoglycerate kinase n=1 Tax=Parvimonas micra TaxID=33033 RepID=A0A9X3K9N5_9FIRM|nr:phosphoglycerate kinase [Parvimonas micra]MCZ7407624.1 phosphoglycerate kinase [Parvimonas micra]MCZ7410619.1 phosphoglycerate kinase [Parvimonas micra]MCZ7412659.1 phosphoglycerate kinase [Parvimonas micra]WBB28810.1 phosphoglycerate kinase [Parvimonas micra]WBB36287.1 phosphoglycerate kinase [Parvimonas micra]